MLEEIRDPTSLKRIWYSAGYVLIFSDPSVDFFDLEQSALAFVCSDPLVVYFDFFNPSVRESIFFDPPAVFFDPSFSDASVVT